ncbi:hypothetical protein AMTRI_Chr10g228810 [Amborella trichopoda]
MGSYSNISYILSVRVDRVPNSAYLHRNMNFNFTVTEWMDVNNMMGTASNRELQTMDIANCFIWEKLQKAQAPWQIIPSLCSEIAHRVCRGSLLNEEIEPIESDFHEVEIENKATEQEGDVIGQTYDPEFLRMAIESLATAVLGVDEEVLCIICLSRINSCDGDATVLPCSHIYHKDCIFMWFELRNFCFLELRLQEKI